MYNLVEYSDNYSKTYGYLRQHCRNEPFINTNGVIIDVPDDPYNSDSASFKSKRNLIRQTEMMKQKMFK